MLPCVLDVLVQDEQGVLHGLLGVLQALLDGGLLVNCLSPCRSAKPRLVRSARKQQGGRHARANLQERALQGRDSGLDHGYFYSRNPLPVWLLELCCLGGECVDTFILDVAAVTFDPVGGDAVKT